MSAVPARPSRPERCSSVAASSAGGIPTCSSSHRTRPGSTLPERVAITRPSSGVKPIVVSTERPSRTAASDAPAPRWQVTSRRPVGGSRRAARPPAATAYAWDRPWKPKRRRSQRSRHSGGQRVGRRRGRQRRRGTRCRSRRRPARPAGRAATTSSAASDFGWWSGARSVSARSRATTPPSIRTGPRELRAAVDDPVPDGVDRRRSRAIASRDRDGVGRPARRRQVGRRDDRVVGASRTRSLRLLDPALTTRIRTPGDVAALAA